VIIEFDKAPNNPVGAVNVDHVFNDLLFITNKARTGGWSAGPYATLDNIN